MDWNIFQQGWEQAWRPTLEIILLAVAIYFVLMFVRRRYVGEGENDKQDPGFSLAGLREMRDRGEITPEEYEAMRAKVIAKVKGTSP